MGGLVAWGVQRGRYVGGIGGVCVRIRLDRYGADSCV